MALERDHGKGRARGLAGKNGGSDQPPRLFHAAWLGKWAVDESVQLGNTFRIAALEQQNFAEIKARNAFIGIGGKRLAKFIFGLLERPGRGVARFGCENRAAQKMSLSGEPVVVTGNLDGALRGFKRGGEIAEDTLRAGHAQEAEAAGVIRNLVGFPICCERFGQLLMRGERVAARDALGCSGRRRLLRTKPWRRTTKSESYAEDGKSELSQHKT